MPIGVRRQYLEKIRLRYLKASKKQKTLILDEFCQVCDYDRKHAIKLLTQAVRAYQPKPGAKLRYSPDVIEHLVILWQAMGKICSKKMVAAIPLWLPFYEGGNADQRWLLQKMSASSVNHQNSPDLNSMQVRLGSVVTTGEEVHGMLAQCQAGGEKAI